jgi:hypothetical protein
MFLRSSFAYPGTSFDLAPTVYVENRPAAFVAGFPRTVRLKDRTLRLTFNTLLTSSVEFKGKGYGAVVWTEFLRRARSAGFDGTVSACADGSSSNGIVVECGKRLNTDMRRVFSIQYLARLLRPAEVTQDTVGVDVVKLFLKATAQVPTSVPLARIWSREEAEWQCLGRTRALCVAHDEGGRSGVVTGYVMDVIDKTPTKVLLIEDLLWGDLQAQERLALLQRLLAQGAAVGARIAVAPMMGYAETATLRGAGFRQSRRLLHVYLTVWNGEPAPEPLSSLYLDIF